MHAGQGWVTCPGPGWHVGHCCQRCGSHPSPEPTVRSWAQAPKATSLATRPWELEQVPGNLLWACCHPQLRVCAGHISKGNNGVGVSGVLWPLVSTCPKVNRREDPACPGWVAQGNSPEGRGGATPWGADGVPTAATTGHHTRGITTDWGWGVGQ